MALTAVTCQQFSALLVLVLPVAGSKTCQRENAEEYLKGAYLVSKEIVSP